MKSMAFQYSCLAFLLAGIFIGCVREESPVVKVESVLIGQTDLTMTEGESVSLTVEVLPKDATDKTVTWTSSDERVAIVSSSGKVGAITAGKAIITAQSGNKSDFVTVTVVPKTIPVTGVSLDKPSIIIEVEGYEQLTPTISPADATNKTILWTSSDPEVATVENGRVTGRSPGSATITATTEDGGKTATCSVEAIPKVVPAVTVGADGISAVSAVLHGKAIIGKSSASDLKMGFQYSSSENILPSNSIQVEASSADEEYKYSKGITGLEPGMTYYYRSYVSQKGQDSFGETMSFKTKELASMLATLDAEDVEVTRARLKAMLNLTDVLYTTMEHGFYWGTDENNLDTKLDGGVVAENVFSASLSNLSPLKSYWYIGYVKLDGWTFLGEVKSFTTDAVPVESVSLDKTEYTFHTIGNTITLKATVLPRDAANKAVEWTTSDSGVATVTSDGLVTAIGNGTATITAKTMDQGKTATCEITVSQYVTDISLNKTSLSLFKGETATLAATVSPDNADDKSLTWTSSDPSVAKVSNTGIVTAISKGTAAITVTANDGSEVSARCDIEVRQLVESISLSESQLTLIEGTKQSLMAVPTPLASDRNITWTSSNEAIASVNPSGEFQAEVTGVAKGTATITVAATDGSGVTAKCIVTVVPQPVPDMVDLGLSVKWASFNIGAFAPEEYGDYFAWGETEPKSNYSYSTYKWCNGSDNTLTKYNTKASNGIVDNKTELDPEDDVAHVKLGGNWRMPTRAEQNELLTQCKWTWTTQNGKTGFRVTGPNGNSVFMPAAGAYGGTSLSYAGNQGICWSSSLYADNPGFVYEMGFSPGDIHMNSYYRCVGLSVRAVYGAPPIHVESVTLDKSALSLAVGRSEQLTASVYPANASIKTVSWSSSNTSIATVSSSGVVTAKAVGSTTITATSLDGDASGSCIVTVSPPVPEAVDLGLSVKWANYNIGASAPEEIGEHFAWGETATKGNYGWGTYRYWISGGSYSDIIVSKYNSVSSYGQIDNKSVLEPTDDVAHVKWGGNWRMPTENEILELKNNCTWEWTTLNGVYGRKVTSNVAGYTDKWIFLPAAGRYDGSSRSRTDRGYYWCSSLLVGMSDKAYYLFLSSSDVYISVLERSFGLSVRPVCQ